jgi:hypothetical protein
MDLFQKTGLLMVRIMIISMVIVPLAAPAVPAFPMGLMLLEQFKAIQNNPIGIQMILTFLMLLVLKFGITLVGAITFNTSCSQAFLISMYETSYICLKIRSALKYSTKSASSMMKSVPQMVNLYKRAWILTSLFNGVYAFRFYVNLIGLAQFTAIIGFCGTFGFPSGTAMIIPAVMMAVNLSIMIAVTFMLTVASTVWIESVEFLENLRMRQKQSKNVRLVKMTIRSLPPLKIKIGSVNFIEKMTPFVSLSFMMEQSISLIIVNK